MSFSWSSKAPIQHASQDVMIVHLSLFAILVRLVIRFLQTRLNAENAQLIVMTVLLLKVERQNVLYVHLVSKLEMEHALNAMMNVEHVLVSQNIAQVAFMDYIRFLHLMMNMGWLWLANWIKAVLSKIVESVWMEHL